jgi:hypothetical protein
MNYSSINEAYDLYNTIETDYNIISDDLNIYNDDFYDNDNDNANGNRNANGNDNGNANGNDYRNGNANDNNNANGNDYRNANGNANDNNNDNRNVNIDAKKLLRDYKTLIKILNENKIKSINLDKKKEDIINYKSNIYVKHQNAMLQLCRETPENIDTNEMTDHIIKYIDLFKKYADRWINEYYIINKNKLTENIEKQEIKLLAYRNLFINTTKEIIPLEKISKNICPICFDNEINMCAIPCGHTCCNECVMQSLKYNSKLTKCLNCRNTLKEYIKLFIQL